MPFNLFKSSKSKIGVDIGTSSIKIAELGQEGGRWKLLGYAFVDLKGVGGSADAGGTVLDLPDQEVSQSIRQALEVAGMKGREAVASISSLATFATVIEMPYTSEEELAQSIPFEARKYIPVPLDQVVLDWSIIGTVPAVSATGATTPTVEVFLAAVPKDDTARYQRILKAAGLQVTALELENASLVRALLGNDLSPTAIINVGGRSTSIIIVSKGYERLSHNYEIGGYEMTKAIASALNISFDQAESIKRRYGLTDSPDNKGRAALLPLADMMLFETKKTIESFEQSHGTRMSRVVVVGGLANMPGLATYVKQRIDRDVLVGNVFARLLYPEELAPLVQPLSNTLAIAIGAAMRET